MAFKMKGMNHGEGTGSSFKKLDDYDQPLPKTSKIKESIAAMEKAYTGKASGKDYDRDIKIFKDYYGDDAAKSLAEKLSANLQDYEIPQGEYTAEKPYEAAEVGKGQVGIFNPVNPRFDYSKIDYGRGGKPRTEWKKHTTEELEKIIKDKPHRFGGFDPVKDADRMNEILRPSKLTYADKYGKRKKLVRYEYGDSVRFGGWSKKEKEEVKGRQEKRRKWHQSHKAQYIKGTGDKKPDAVKPLPFPKEAFHPPKAQTWTGTNPMKPKSPLKFGRKYKK